MHLTATGSCTYQPSIGLLAHTKAHLKHLTPVNNNTLYIINSCWPCRFPLVPLTLAFEKWLKTRLPFNPRQTTPECVYLIKLVKPFASVTLTLTWRDRIRKWPRYSQDVTAYPVLKFLVQGFQQLQHRQTDVTKHITKYHIHLLVVIIYSTNCTLVHLSKFRLNFTNVLVICIIIGYYCYCFYK